VNDVEAWSLKEMWVTEFEIKKSRFVTTAAPISSRSEAELFLEAARDLTASHNCWAFRIGNDYRFSDDGEPSGTAGKPILASIHLAGFDGVVVLVTRFFGGIKLGAGGLTRAYSAAASECLKDAPKVPLVPTELIRINAPYDYMSIAFSICERFEKIDAVYHADGISVTIRIPCSQFECVQDEVRDESSGIVNVERLDSSFQGEDPDA